MKETRIIMSGDHPKLILEGKKTQTRRVVSPSTSIVGVGPVDWSHFDWEQKTEYDFGCSRYSTESEFIPDELKGQFIGIKKAPLPFVDGNLEKYHYQYLHVPYRWGEDATVYRIYPKWDVGDRLWARETWATDQMFDKMSAKGIEGTGIATVPLWYKVCDYQLDRERQTRGRWRSSRFMPRWASRITLEITEIRVERLQEITKGDLALEGYADIHIDLASKWFVNLWNSLNTKRGYGWDVNPWVWVISFRML